MSLSSIQAGLLKKILDSLESGESSATVVAMIAEMLESDSMASTSEAPEFLTISATTTSSGVNFSTYTADNIQEVAIQNLSDTVDVYVNFSSTEAPTADITHTCIPAGAMLSLTDTDYIYFAGITAADTATIRITGLG